MPGVPPSGTKEGGAECRSTSRRALGASVEPGNSRPRPTARDAARAGRGSVLAVTGTAGVGKTWLVESIAGVAAAEGFRVGWGSTWLAGDAPPLWPWQRAIAELGGQLPAALLEHPPDTESAEWFRQCATVVEQLAELSDERPCMVVIDDAHAADEATVRLAHFVARHVRGMHLVLVVAHQPSERLAAFDREATTIALHGLGAAEVAAVLSDRGIEGCSDDDIAFMVGATDGLPFEVHRVATSAPNAAAIVRSLVEQRIAALSPDVALGAAYAAVYDAAPRLSHVAAITADKEIDSLAVATELERLGLATRRAPDSLMFTHEVVRATLAERVDPEDVVEIHARGAVAGGRTALDRPAATACGARARGEPAFGRRCTPRDGDHAGRGGRARRGKRTPTSRRASRRGPSTRVPPPGSGVRRPRCSRRRPKRCCGAGSSPRRTSCFGRAATAAEEDDDAISLGLAALGLGGVWLAEQRSPIERERILGLQRRARDGLPEEAAALRVRLDARLAAEDAYGTGEFTAIEAQVEAARALGDPAVLAEALSLHHHTVLGPEHREIRSQIVREMLSAVADANDNSLSLMALLWFTADLFLVGSPQAERSLRELHERAAALAGKHAAYIAGVMDVMLLQRAGRLDEAERAATEAFAAGTEVGDADAVAYYGSQIVALRWIQGRAAEVVELAADTAASPTITPANHAFTAVFASLAADCGEHDRARAALSRLRGSLHAMPQSSAWLATLFSTVEAAYSIGDAEIAREAATLMAPYADLPVLGSLAVVCLGSPRRSLGLAALTIGDLDAGITLLEQAIADDERLGNRPLAALTAADLARAHLDRAQPNDREIASELLDRAIREADAMGLTLRADDWRKLRGGYRRTSRADRGSERRRQRHDRAPGVAVGARRGRARDRGSRPAGHELSRAAAHEPRRRHPGRRPRR